MSLYEEVESARRSSLIRWIIDPHIMGPPPVDTTFEEINDALDDIQDLIDKRREEYPIYGLTKRQAIRKVLKLT